MQEGKRGVERLLNSIYQNISENEIDKLAQLLNYVPGQLKEDIQAIPTVKVIDKEK